MTVLTDYVRAVTDNAAQYKEAEAYYLGNTPETFASAKLGHVLRATGHTGVHNYCRVVVDAVLNRLEVANILCDKVSAQKKLDDIWRDNELGLESFEIHRNALTYGDAYALVWPGEDGELLISYNSPRTTALVYDPENPRKKLYAVKMWKTATQPDSTNTGKTRMNVYTKDAIYKYESDTAEVSEGTQWTQIGQEDNPFGEIPVFHFRTSRPMGKPEHLEAYGCQNDINKLVATHMYTVDYQGAPQRYALAMENEADAVDFGDDETERENVGSLASSPGTLWYLKGIHGVGQFQPADPKVFWEPIKDLKESMAALTDTPYHYLERGLSGVSGGESLRVSEAPLLKKVADRQVSFGATWREIANFILKVEGFSGVNVEVKWSLVESLDALGQWDVMLKKINAGLSHRQALREAGYEDADIERIMEERAMEAAEGAYYQRTPQARTSVEDNENFENRNGKTEQAKDNGGRGETDETNGGNSND